MKSKPCLMRTSVTDLFAIGSPRFGLDVPCPRLASRRCAMLVGPIRSASPRTAATAVPRLARPSVAPRGAPLTVAVGVSFDERGGNIAPVALGQQVLDVNLGQRGRTLALQHAPGRLVLGGEKRQCPALDAHAGGAPAAVSQPLRR